MINGLKWHPRCEAKSRRVQRERRAFAVGFLFLVNGGRKKHGDALDDERDRRNSREQFVEPKLVKWKSFDGREISGFLYLPNESKFPGKHPVIINIHGGPEAQFRPTFAGRNNYFINELGCAMIMPNVRGSNGYGKSFLKLDNGFKREDSYKDISALLDWIRRAGCRAP